MYVYILLVLLLPVMSVYPDYPEKSECSEYFRYITDSNNNVRGLITIPYTGGKIMDLQVTGAMRGHFSEEKSKMKVRLLSNLHALKRQNTREVVYKVKFSLQSSIPQIISIIFNGHIICQGPPLPDPYSRYTTVHASHRFLYHSREKRKRVPRTKISGLMDSGENGSDYIYPLSNVDYAMSLGIKKKA